MGLESIHIKNYKCIRDYKINLKQLNLLLGENGSGKTNILSAISYFYDNMISQNLSYDIFDNNNPLNDQVEITLTYNLGKLLMRSRKNRNEGKNTYLNYYNAIERVSKDGSISLTLSQVKGEKITWNHGIDKRKALYHMYPLYRLDAREINLVDWEDLWEDIGDLVKPTVDEVELISGNVRNMIAANSSQLEGRLKLLEELFERLQIKTVHYSVSEFASSIAKVYYGGDEFSYIGHKLGGFSNGTNSYNYISLMLYVLSAIGRMKMKEPVLLMDEPEISLHFHMIDELADVIFTCIDDTTVLASTHSPRLVKNVLVKEKNECTVYQVYKRGNYSQLCLLSLFSRDEKRERYFLTEHHANAFFAKILVLVEGETEVELLQNPYLKILFPVLKEIEIIKGMSDKVVYRIVDTTTRHYNVPMATLLDMDKILEWDYENKRMRWKREYKFVANNEKYYYGRKRNDTINRRKRILAMCEKCHFSYQYPFYATEDDNYREFIQLIQEYYHNYHIYPVKTTIEGVLVNQDTYELVIQYLKKIRKWDIVEKAYEMLYSRNDKVNFLRLLFQGKNDFFLKSKDVLSYNKKINPLLKDALSERIVGKTSWVTEWLRFYFSHRTEIPLDKLTEKEFLEWCKDSGKKYTLTMRVMGDFQELTEFVNSLERLYKISLT